MAVRLGVNPESDWALVERFLNFCEITACDWTRVLRALAEGKPDEASILMRTKSKQEPFGWQIWLEEWKISLVKLFEDQQAAIDALTQVNPCVLPRTHLLQQAIDQAEQGDFTEVNRLLAVFRHPFSAQGKQPKDMASVPDWIKSQTLSCSS